jgi:hypothetical protein
MSDENSKEIKEMHPLFADWMRPSMLGADRDMLTLRWETISKIVSTTLSLGNASQLISYVYGKKYSEENLRWFQELFKDDDLTFSMLEEKNSVELICLASSVLCLFLEKKDENAADIGNRILTTSFDVTRENKGVVPLEAKSKEAVQAFAINGRKRPETVLLTGINTKKTTDEAIDLIVQNNWPQINATLKTIMSTHTRSINNVTKLANANFESLNAHVKTQDEELDVLWWMVNGYSKRLNCKMDVIEDICKTSVIGLEIADLTVLDTELPCLEALLQKAGIQNDDTDTISNRVIALKDYVTTLLPKRGYVDPFLTPCHTALFYLNEYNSDGWSDRFHEETGIAADKKYTSLQWAVQLYREQLIIKMER